METATSCALRQGKIPVIKRGALPSGGDVPAGSKKKAGHPVQTQDRRKTRKKIPRSPNSQMKKAGSPNRRGRKGREKSAQTYFEKCVLVGRARKREKGETWGKRGVSPSLLARRASRPSY